MGSAVFDYLFMFRTAFDSFKKLEKAYETNLSFSWANYRKES